MLPCWSLKIAQERPRVDATAQLPQFLHDCSNSCNASTPIPHSMEPGISLWQLQSQSFRLVSPDRLDLEKKHADFIYTSLVEVLKKPGDKGPARYLPAISCECHCCIYTYMHPDVLDNSVSTGMELLQSSNQILSDLFQVYVYCTSCTVSIAGF